MARPWLVLRQGDRLRWGGDLRRRYLPEAFAQRIAAAVVEDWYPSAIRSALRRQRGRRWQVWRSPGRIVSTDLLADSQLAAVLEEGGVPFAVDIHDDPLLQAATLGLAVDPATEQTVRARFIANLESFPWLIAPSAEFAQLAGLPAARVILASNGTHTAIVRPEPWPSDWSVGLVSGAGPGRGIETLVDAVRLVRREVPGVRLLLWLAGTGPSSEDYVDNLANDLARESWIEIGSVPYERLGAELGRVSCLCIPAPASTYWDGVAPLKLFDGMASGRPTIVTPRPATAAIVREHEAGLVASDDSADALAAALLRLVANDGLARRLGENARRAAETTFDWRVVGRSLADELLRRAT